MQEIRIGNIYGATGGNFAGNVYDKKGIAPTINTCGGWKRTNDNRKSNCSNERKRSSKSIR